jgi:hypothetical protein
LRYVLFVVMIQIIKLITIADHGLKISFGYMHVILEAVHLRAGAVAYRSTAAPVYQILCVCTQCQAVGGGFGCGSAVVPKAALDITKGEDQLASFTMPGSAAAVVRRFCKTCGTHVAASNGAHPVVALNAGTLAPPMVFAPQVAIWCQSKTAIHTFPEGLPQFAQYPPPG